MTNPLFLVDSHNDDAPISRDELRSGWTMSLPPDVRRHAFGSMRLTQSDALQVSDGQGLRIDATVADPAEGTVLVDSFTVEDAPRIRLALVQALAKNGHDEQAIDMATQIGVDDVIPWQSDRAIARFKAGRTDRKWGQVLRAATEQSRRAFLPVLHEPMSSRQLLAQVRRACVHGDLVIVLHQDATIGWGGIEDRLAAIAERSLEDGRTRTIHVAVGPEGGISDDEVAMLTEAGAEAVVLGSNILRASTAGPVALSLLSRALGRFS
ncbi:16S rRNA (uracil(1498)-N(3))-methyltransferase [Bifidobacterium cuniculi]|uniref:Ribosomal RNA small subunit methyltransferase E n=1 Tax=Bifidobacterium cuniculi TaxID=1688 RepID=A0A087B4C5_9BIFI|nr:16S rRNA (uracil(1498)-N(3))-methyltransferase [Bifidobacterium cuniculi]KFI65875.1 16S ribosomal RNA methyltransferase RsmE [Bifidobacterium cuniculi]